MVKYRIMLIQDGVVSETPCKDKTGYQTFETEDPMEAIRTLFWYKDKIKPNHPGCNYQLAMSGGFTLVPGVIV